MNTTVNQKETLEVKDLPNIMSISIHKAYQLCSEPGFPAFRIGRKVLINRAKLNEWIDKQIENNCNCNSSYMEK